MADADEDVIHLSTSSSSQQSTGIIDNDLSDETQDFRFLSTFSLYIDPPHSTQCVNDQAED
jgi:tRNA-splicing endonuclease subunit Sen54